jgi:carbon storage regulator
MLVLSRKRGEGLVIGNGIKVTVLDVRGSQVKFGFVAPVDVPIRRKEIQRASKGSRRAGELTLR